MHSWHSTKFNKLLREQIVFIVTKDYIFHFFPSKYNPFLNQTDTRPFKTPSLPKHSNGRSGSFFRCPRTGILALQLHLGLQLSIFAKHGDDKCIINYYQQQHLGKLCTQESVLPYHYMQKSNKIRINNTRTMNNTSSITSSSLTKSKPLPNPLKGVIPMISAAPKYKKMMQFLTLHTRKVK